MFQAVCSEIDVLGKVLAKEVNSSFTPSKKTGINEWWYFVTEDDAGIIDRKYNLFGERDLQPWKNYRVVKNGHPGAKKYILDEENSPKAKTPSWWNDYNSVKHNRTGRVQKYSTNYSKANLCNLFLAFAALYSIEVKLMEKVKKDSNNKVESGQESKLFEEKVSFYTYNLSV